MRMISRLSQEQFKNQEKFPVSSFQESRIKNNQEQDSRLKIQESRKDSIKISTKKFFKTLSST